VPYKPQAIDNKVRSQIYGHGRGWVFTRKHFQGVGSTAAIESALRRMRKEGAIRLLARGLYDYHKRLRMDLAPKSGFGLTRDEAERLEEFHAEHLRARGHAVWQH